MAMIKNRHGKQYYLDNKLKHNIDVLLDGARDNDDLLIVVDGPERAGKSLFMRQIANYCAEKMGTYFSVDNIHFSLKDYIDYSIEAPWYTVNILDEGRKILNRKSAMAAETVKFTNYMSECAKKRQIHIIACPAFHDLDKYIVNWRMKLLVHIHKSFVEDSSTDSGYRLKRGDYTVYAVDNHLTKSYFFPYSYPKKYAFMGRFNDVEVLKSVDPYEKKKDANLLEKYHSSQEQERINKYEEMWRSRALRLVISLEEFRDIKRGEMADMMGIQLSNLNTAIQRNGKSKR